MRDRDRAWFEWQFLLIVLRTLPAARWRLATLAGLLALLAVLLLAQLVVGWAQP